MQIIVMGAGRVGKALTARLCDLGHDVVIIDSDDSALKTVLTPSARTVRGLGFDRDVLAAAAVDTADAFLAVTNRDNANIVAARIARDEYGISSVVARVADHRRAEVVEKLGIPTVATVPWAVDRLLATVLGERHAGDLTDPTGEVTIFSVELHEDWFGRDVRSFEQALGVRVCFVQRLGRTAVPSHRTRFQPEEKVWVVAPTHRRQDVTDLARLAPGEGVLSL